MNIMQELFKFILAFYFKGVYNKRSLEYIA